MHLAVSGAELARSEGFYTALHGGLEAMTCWRHIYEW